MTPEIPVLSPESLSSEAKGKIQGNLPALVDNFELADCLVFPSPFVLTEGLDTRQFFELSFQDQLFIEGILNQELGVPEGDNFILRYMRTAPERAEWTGSAPVDVFRTGLAQEGMFIHMTKFPDGKIDIVIAPRDFRL